MALEKCNECNSLMSDKAPTCLNCGYPIATNGSTPREGLPSVQTNITRAHDVAIFGTFASMLVLTVIMLSQF